MKFKEYVEHLNNLLKENPESAEYDVVYSKDDEGNGYDYVGYEPTLVQFIDKEEVRFPTNEDGGINDVILNAVIIN